MLPNQILDRYGDASGSFLSPAGTSIGERSLLPDAELRLVTSYDVLQPFNAGAGRVAQWGGQPGGGLQFDLRPNTVQDLISNGVLRPKP